jgi:Phosphotransferase enzyme family
VTDPVEFIASAIWPDAVLERSILGTDDPDQIWQQVLRACPDAVECFAFLISVGALFGLRLRDGSRIALKIHGRGTPAESLEAIQRVQEHLWREGFPCPRPLGTVGSATLEEWQDDGIYRDAHEPEVRRVMAQHLARLFTLARELLPLPGLEPFLPPSEGPLWPAPHNALFDFEATTQGAEWIDEIARAAREVRDAQPADLVIGHGDWSVKHFRFDGARPTVIYDWDSLGTDYETVLVGSAAASFTYTEHSGPVDVWPTLDEALGFLEDYRQARGRPLTPEEERATGAAAVYSRAYSTRCTHAVGKDAPRLQLREFAAAFL